MADPGERKPDEESLSARQLVLVFLAGVAVCAVFFALGFLVGYNEQSSKGGPLAEQVAPPAVVPPTVNPPLETPPAASGRGTTSPTRAADTSATSAERISSRPAPDPKLVARAASAPSPPPPARGFAAKPPSAAGAAPTGQVTTGFAIQVAASRAKQDAEALVKILAARGYKVFLVTPEYAHANDNLFRVQVGPFATREVAEAVRAKLVKEGFKPFIRR